MRARNRGVATAASTFILQAVVAALALAGENVADSAGLQESDAAKTKLFIVHFSVGPSWAAEKPPNQQASFGEHGRNLKRLRDQGRIVLGARYGDKGMIVLRAESEEGARTEMNADPGVRAGIFAFELFELRPFYDGCLSVEPVRPAAVGED